MSEGGPLLFACTAPSLDSDEGVPDDTDPVDDRVDAPEPAVGAERWITPEVVIPPYTEILYCWAATFQEGVQGLASFERWQGLSGHHVGWSTTPLDQRELPDGMMVDCIRVQDVIDLGWRPPSEVTTWAVTFGVLAYEFRVPPHQVWSLSIDCHMGQDITALWIAAHMHEYGERFNMEIARADGASETLFDVAWKRAMRFEPPILEPEGGFQLKKGDKLTVECTWNNDTDRELSFPAEMRGAPGMVIPAEHTVLCQPER